MLQGALELRLDELNGRLRDKSQELSQCEAAVAERDALLKVRRPGGCANAWRQLA